MSQIEERLKRCILAVDDSAIVLTRISSILRNDYEVVTVNSGVRALRYLELEKPDLILLDIQMAQQDGIETLRQIRSMEECGDIPVIMLTGVETKEAVLESSRLGICDYLLKPFSSTELHKRISRVFELEEKEDGES
ncbi:MAG: response regulator [Lachnospiraceae bacterium]|jgi:CheY-like chemotaxis protein|nr:response regulator [Lachnospiraceae bacterium]